MNKIAQESVDNNGLQEIWKNLGDGNRNKNAFEKAIRTKFGPWTNLTLHPVSGGGWNISGTQNGHRSSVYISFIPTI